MNIHNAGSLRPLAVITGASAGIGEAIASELHERGYRVHLVARREDRLVALSDTFNERVTDSASYSALDLTDRASCAQLESYLAASDVELLVNNVGRGSYGDFAALDRDKEEQMVVLNTIVPLRLAHAAIPVLKQQAQKGKRAGIIFLSSIASFQPLPFMSTYAATKSFNLSQSLSLREELRPFGIHVTAVCPGPVETEFGLVAGAPLGQMKVKVDSASFIARSALDAFEANRAVVIPGWSARCMAYLSMLVPRALSVRLVRAVIAPS
jgi:short-subunit dehydrogenase